MVCRSGKVLNTRQVDAIHAISRVNRTSMTNAVRGGAAEGLGCIPRHAGGADILARALRTVQWLLGAAPRPLEMLLPRVLLLIANHWNRLLNHAVVLMHRMPPDRLRL